jgi:hypothetical protein
MSETITSISSTATGHNIYHNRAIIAGSLLVITLIAAAVLGGLALKTYLDYIDVRMQTNWSFNPDYAKWHQLCTEAQNYFYASMCCLGAAFVAAGFFSYNHVYKKKGEGQLSQEAVDLSESSRQVEIHKGNVKSAQVALITSVIMAISAGVGAYFLTQYTVDYLWHHNLWDVLVAKDFLEKLSTIAKTAGGFSAAGVVLSVASYAFYTYSRGKQAYQEGLIIKSELAE